jgi:protein TonB
LNIKKFILFSIIIHIGIVVGLYFMPEEVKKKPAAFLARLVSPEELQKAEKIPVPPPLKKGPLRLPQKTPMAPIQPKYMPSTEKPVAPGMGKEAGKQLPEGVIPGQGKSEKQGEGLDPRTHPGTTDGDSDKSDTKDGKLSDKPGYLDRSKLFDRGVIAESARKQVAGARKKDDTITFDTSDYRYAGYMKKLKEKIESIWVYPPEAAARGIYGDLKIRFTILKNGKLGEVELVRTSGNKLLDDAAMKALKDGEPYWPIPAEWGMESYTVPGHFIYSIYGYGLR